MDEDGILKQKDIFPVRKVLSYKPVVEKALNEALGKEFVKKYVGVYFPPDFCMDDEKSRNKIWFIFYIRSKPFMPKEKRDFKKDFKLIIFECCLSVELKTNKVVFYEPIEDLAKQNFKEINISSKNAARKKCLAYIRSRAPKEEAIIKHRDDLLKDIKNRAYYAEFKAAGRLYWSFRFLKFPNVKATAECYAGPAIYDIELLVDAETGEVKTKIWS